MRAAPTAVASLHAPSLPTRPTLTSPPTVPATTTDPFTPSQSIGLLDRGACISSTPLLGPGQCPLSTRTPLFGLHILYLFWGVLLFHHKLDPSSHWTCFVLSAPINTSIAIHPKLCSEWDYILIIFYLIFQLMLS